MMNEWENQIIGITIYVYSKPIHESAVETAATLPGNPPTILLVRKKVGFLPYLLGCAYR